MRMIRALTHVMRRCEVFSGKRLPYIHVIEFDGISMTPIIITIYIDIYLYNLLIFVRNKKLIKILVSYGCEVKCEVGPRIFSSSQKGNHHV
jgi:hypothetical protein